MKPRSCLIVTAIAGLTLSSCGTVYQSTKKGEDDYEAAIEDHYRAEQMRKHREKSMDELHDRSIRQ